MTASNVRPLTLSVLGLVLLGGALRVWAWISFPALDGYDRSPLIGAAVGGAVFIGVGLVVMGRQPIQTRIIAALVGVAVGCSLGLGAYQVANGLLDRSPTRWLQYAVADHWQGRHSILSLTRVGQDGPKTLWVAETSTTKGAANGTPVAVPMRPGALHSEWRPEEIRLTAAPGAQSR